MKEIVITGDIGGIPIWRYKTSEERLLELIDTLEKENQAQKLSTRLAEMIQKAARNMESQVDFDEVKHIYKLKSGEWLQGVSTVSSIVPKDWLSAWGAKECAKFLGYSDYKNEIDRKKALGMMERISNIYESYKTLEQDKTIDEYIDLLKEAKGACARKSKDALVDGKLGHAWLEEYVKAKINNTPIPEIPDGMLERPLMQFIQWEQENVAYWILSEAKVVNPEKKYAGTLDAVAVMKNGKLALVDFKFASHISEDYYLQTAGYQACFEPYKIPFQTRIIIRLPKTLEREEYNPKTHTYSMVENNIDVVEVPTTYEEDKQAFFGALPVKAWCNKFKKSFN